MKVLITGIDGYLGWPLALYLKSRGHTVGGCDAYFRRNQVEQEMNSQSAMPIATMETRLQAFEEKFGEPCYFKEGDLTSWDFVKEIFEEFKPDAVVHLGECPSAPYSMMDVHHTTWVQQNNVIGSLNVLYAIRDITPNAHLVKLGTMGEYGTPNIDIPEGFFEVEFRGRKDYLPFPRQAGSWYHWSKVHDSNNVEFACKIWGIRSTDVMQGVVYGTRIDEMGDDERLFTRLDFDQCFGTAINRFSCQAAIGSPLTPYGKGTQTRAFLPLKDSMQCLTIAIEHPPKEGEYRVFNQFEQTYNIFELANKVKAAGNEVGLEVQIQPIDNPRLEKEEHYFNPDHKHLLDLGYQPTSDMHAELVPMLKDLCNYKDRIAAHQTAMVPKVQWTANKTLKHASLEATAEAV